MTIQKFKFRANRKRKCLCCGQTPTVNIVYDPSGAVFDRTELCGPCFFGTAEAIDVTAWDGLETGLGGCNE